MAEESLMMLTAIHASNPKEIAEKLTRAAGGTPTAERVSNVQAAAGWAALESKLGKGKKSPDGVVRF